MAYRPATRTWADEALDTGYAVVALVVVGTLIVHVVPQVVAMVVARLYAG